VSPRSLQQQLAWRLGLLFVVVFLAGILMLFYRYRAGDGELPTEELMRLVREVAADLVPGAGGKWQVNLPPDHVPIEYVVRDASGTVLAASSPTAATDLGPPPEDWGRGIYEHGPPSNAVTVAFARTNSVVGPVTIQVTEAVSENAQPARSAGEELIEDVLPILLPFVAAALIIGVFTIRGSLAPLRAVAREAAAITPSETHRRLTETALPRELQPLVVAVNGALDRLDEGFRRQREFTADAAHELRTPLAVLAAHLEGLDERGRLATLREDVERMTRLVNQLLSVAQLEALAVAPGETTDLHALAVDVAASLAPLAVRQGKDIAVTGAAGPVLVHGNSEALRQAVRNLIENGLQHTPQGTAVEVDVTTSPSLSVQDRGPGVPAAMRDRVAQRFWRADRRRSGGAGLGLAIVKRIVDAHGGTLEVGDTDCQGARFTIRLPPEQEGGPPPRDSGELDRVPPG